MDENAPKDARLVSVLRTEDSGLLPLAKIALEQEGIDYTVQRHGLSDQIMGHRWTKAVGETAAPFEIFVRPEDSSRARDLLRDLEQSGEPLVESPAPPVAEPVPAAASSATVDLSDAETGASIGRVTEAQFASLAGHLELESSDDTDYYIDASTLQMLEDRHADAAAIELLRRALGPRTGMDVHWTRR